MVYSNGVSTLFMDMWGGEILTIPEIHIQTTLPPPPILSDSGRALSAYGVSRIDHSDARWADRVCLDYPPPPRETCAAAARHLTSVFTSKGKACFTYLIRLRVQ